MLKRFWPVVALVAVVVALVTAFVVRSAPQPQLAEPISVRFPIPVVENGQSPFYAALENGAYAAEKLDVKFEMGSPELNPVAMVVSGRDQIGVLGGPDTLLAANSNGADLVAVAVLHRNSNFPVIITLANSGITDVQQLSDRRMGFFYGHISTDVLRNFLRRSSVSVTEVDIGFDYAPLISGAIDAAWGFRVTAGLDLPKQGVAINMIDPGTAGINSHGYTIFVKRQYLEENRELIERFLRATFKGVQLVVADPALGSATIESRNTSAPPDVSLARQLLYNEVTSGRDGSVIGFMDQAMFAETYDRLLEEGVVKPGLDVSAQFDRSIVDALDMKLDVSPAD